MNCERARELMAASWAAEPAPELGAHLRECPACAAEMARLTALWDRLGDIPAPEPSSAMTARWEASLDLLLNVKKPRILLWPRRPIWQMAIAATCLAIGVLLGRDLSGISQLREEVRSTRQMVALSLLQQESATERLRGVDYTQRLPAMEPDVVAALVHAVNSDSNVNVRLAAIDALAKVSGDAQVRRSLVSSLPVQESPMVQAALIDYVRDAGDRTAVGELRRLTVRPDLNPLVKQRADAAVQRLTEYK